MEEYYIVKVVAGRIVKVLCVDSLPDELVAEASNEEKELSEVEKKQIEYLNRKIAFLDKLDKQTEGKK